MCQSCDLLAISCRFLRYKHVLALQCSLCRENADDKEEHELDERGLDGPEKLTEVNPNQEEQALDEIATGGQALSSAACACLYMGLY